MVGVGAIYSGQVTPHGVASDRGSPTEPTHRGELEGEINRCAYHHCHDYYYYYYYYY